MWTWDQDIACLAHNGVFVSRGYSGMGEGKNNTAMEAVRNVGPIPRGVYEIGSPGDSIHTGPLTIPLTPRAGTETFGRDAFRIHGDSGSHPGEASHGCIILGRPVRQQIVDSGDTLLEVV